MSHGGEGTPVMGGTGGRVLQHRRRGEGEAHATCEPRRTEDPAH
jgi:hypothetical protein